MADPFLGFPFSQWRNAARREIKNLRGAKFPWQWLYLRPDLAVGVDIRAPATMLGEIRKGEGRADSEIQHEIAWVWARMALIAEAGAQALPKDRGAYASALIDLCGRQQELARRQRGQQQRRAAAQRPRQRRDPIGNLLKQAGVRPGMNWLDAKHRIERTCRGIARFDAKTDELIIDRPELGATMRRSLETFKTRVKKHAKEGKVREPVGDLATWISRWRK